MDYRVFVDSDVIIDVLAERKEFLENSSIILELIKDKIIKGHTSPVIIANINYMLTKYGNRKIARESIKDLLKYISVLSITEEIIIDAVNSKMKDFEDAIQFYTALDNKIDILITRNADDYTEKKNIEIMKPDEFVKILNELNKNRT